MAIMEVTYNQGKWEFKHPDNENVLKISESDLTFDPSKKSTGIMADAKLNLMHVSENFDQWFNETLNIDCKFLYHHSDLPLRPVRQKFSEIYPENFTSTDITTCNWTSQATLISWASIKDVNQRLGRDVNHIRYRSNLIVRTNNSTKPYQEDEWMKIR